MTSDGNEMTFWDHLESLRWSLVRVCIALAAVFAVILSFLPKVFDKFILGATKADFFFYRWIGFLPYFNGNEFNVDIININVASQFLTHMSTSLWLALLVVFPYLIFELWLFIRPALYENEKKGIRTAFLSGTALFYIGCAVGYCIIFPVTFRFLTQYQLGESIVNQISLNSYITNFLSIIFIIGLVFELPVLLRILSDFGLVTKSFLKKYRRHAIVILMVLAAVITPSGDPFTLMIVFLPLYLLYELSILVVRNDAEKD